MTPSRLNRDLEQILYATEEVLHNFNFFIVYLLDFKWASFILMNFRAIPASFFNCLGLRIISMDSFILILKRLSYFFNVYEVCFMKQPIDFLLNKGLYLLENLSFCVIVCYKLGCGLKPSVGLTWGIKGILLH
jgi:hypothetical protein